MYNSESLFSMAWVYPEMKTFLNLCLIFVLLLCCSAEANDLSAVTEKVEYQDSKMKIAASVLLPVPACGAFRLMTDYDSLPEYIPGMLETHHEYIKQGLVKVWQVGEVEIWFLHFKIKSLLEIQEIPNQKISFKQLEGSLSTYNGEWTLQETPQGTHVRYSAELTFRHFMPVFLARMVLEDEIKKRFAAIAKEAEERKNKNLLDCVAKP